MRNRTTAARLAFAGAVIAALAPLAPLAAATTQGSLGATSQGTVAISVTVPKQVQISGLTDITVASANPNVQSLSTENTCVWTNSSTKQYNITATGSGSGSAFTLAAGTATVPYSVAWATTTGATTGTSMTSGTALTALSSTATTPTCASGTLTSTLLVTVAASDLQSMTALTAYTGTLTLTVSPN